MDDALTELKRLRDVLQAQEREGAKARAQADAMAQQARQLQDQLAATQQKAEQARELQEKALSILQFKLDLLWSMLDAMLLAHCPVNIDGWGAYRQMNKVS